MNTRSIIMIAASAAIILASSCSSNDEEQQAVNLVPITLKSAVETDIVTRANSTIQNSQFDYKAAEGDDPAIPELINIEIIDAKIDANGEPTTTPANPLRASYIFQTTATTATAGDLTPTGTTPYFPYSGNKVNIFGYYPSTVTGSTTSFSVQADQSDAGGYKASDLMYGLPTGGNPVATSTVAIPMGFDHMLSKIIVVATAEGGVSNISEIRIIGGNRTVALSSDGSCTPGTTSDANSADGTYIKMYEGTTASVTCAALIPPQTVSSGNFLQIVTDQGTATYSLSAEKTFEGKHSYTYTISVTKHAISTTTTIIDWDDDEGGNTIDAGSLVL